MTSALASLRNAVRMAVGRGTADDLIAARVIFNPSMDTTPLQPDPNVVDGRTAFVRP